MKLTKSLSAIVSLALVGAAIVGCTGETSSSISSVSSVSSSESTTPSTSVVEEVVTKDVTVGLGLVVGAKLSSVSTETPDVKTLTEVSVTAAAASFDEEGKVISVEFDVMQIPLELVEGKVTLKATAKQVKDAGAKLVETKQELTTRYGMIGASTIGKEAYEQLRSFADFVEGKTIAEALAYGFTKRDDNHPFVPGEGTLAASVSITVQDYFNALMEAYEMRKAPVAVDEDAVLSSGIGLTIGVKKDATTQSITQLDVTAANVTVDAEDNIQGVVLDTLQIPLALSADATPLVSIASKKQTQEAGYKVVESKRELGVRYGMYYQGSNGAYTLNEGATAEWFEQANTLENWLVGQKTTALDFTGLKFEGTHALVSSVTITVSGYFETAKEAAAYAKVLPVPAAA